MKCLPFIYSFQFDYVQKSLSSVIIIVLSLHLSCLHTGITVVFYNHRFILITLFNGRFIWNRENKNRKIISHIFTFKSRKFSSAKFSRYTVSLFLHHCLSVRCLAAVTICCGLAIISRFCQVECAFSNISTCVHLPVGGNFLVFLALTFKYKSCTAGTSSICWSL